MITLSTNNVNFKTCKNKLHSDCIKDPLDEIQQNFIFNPIDKVNRNVAVIWKRFYALTVIEELGQNKTIKVTPKCMKLIWI